MKRAIVRSLAKVARLARYELVPRWRLDYWERAEHLRQVFSRMDIQCVLDVGAHKGRYRDFLRLVVGYAGHIISFEPVAHLAADLKRASAKDDAWTVYPFALGSTDAELALNIMAASDLSSLLTPDTSAVPEFERFNRIVDRQPVSVKRLDSIMDMLRCENPVRNIFLKTDTQGYDLEVARGAERTLSEVLAVQSEMSLRPIYAGMPDWITAVHFMQDRGFDITGMFPVSRDSQLRLVEFDCVMVNRTIKQLTGPTESLPA
ncbi:MAG TPA: FkbM family methyltransferase [Candidatus Nitrosotalea sp.]|nr:FkbM family methyltransferase [Candidatus Nitrosotalea sp.]